MPFWSRRGKSASVPGATRADRDAVEAHLRQFVESRLFVEGYVEPSTNITSTTVVLIAHDGEWTRRAVATREDAFGLGKRLEIPVYDVNQTGYPARMREWTARQRRDGKA